MYIYNMTSRNHLCILSILSHMMINMPLLLVTSNNYIATVWPLCHSVHLTSKYQISSISYYIQIHPSTKNWCIPTYIYNNMGYNIVIFCSYGPNKQVINSIIVMILWEICLDLFIPIGRVMDQLITTVVAQVPDMAMG